MKYQWAQPQTIQPQPVEEVVEVTDDVPDCYKGEAVALQQKAERQAEENVEQVLGRIDPAIANDVILRCVGDMSVESLKQNLKAVTREKIDELKRRK